MDFTDFISCGIDHVFTFVKKVYVAAVSSKSSSTTFEMQEILGTRMGYTICRFTIPVSLKCLQKRRPFSESPKYSEIKDLSNNRQNPSEQDRFVDEQTRIKWKYSWHV